MPGFGLILPPVSIIMKELRVITIYDVIARLLWSRGNPTNRE